LRQLDAAPRRREPVRRQHQDDGMTTRQFLVKPLLPTFTGANAGFLVEIEKHFLEAEPIERRLDVVGDLRIEARMTDENSGHLPVRNRLGSIQVAGDPPHYID
jgi:hypothetical protein